MTGNALQNKKKDPSSTLTLFKQALSCCSDPLLVSERSERDTLRSVQLQIGDIYIMVRAISVYSAGVPYAARFTAVVKIPLPLATFQF